MVKNLYIYITSISGKSQIKDKKYAKCIMKHLLRQWLSTQACAKFMSKRYKISNSYNIKS